jgi:hypothetical protein
MITKLREYSCQAAGIPVLKYRKRGGDLQGIIRKGQRARTIQRHGPLVLLVLKENLEWLYEHRKQRGDAEI